MTPIRVFLIDDHTVLRQAVRVMLEAEQDVSVVGEAGDAREGIEGITALRPDVAMIDVKMPGLSGVSAIPEIRRCSPRTAIVVFTMFDSPSYVYEAMQAGATGYVLKSASKEDLLRAIRAVHGGGGFLQAEVTRPLLKRLALDARVESEKSNLSAREIQVLELLSEGKSNKEIGAVLSISDETVKSHLKRLYDKLGASDRAQAVAIALRQNLID